jgi:hypothetical protein
LLRVTLQSGSRRIITFTELSSPWAEFKNHIDHARDGPNATACSCTRPVNHQYSKGELCCDYFRQHPKMHDMVAIQTTCQVAAMAKELWKSSWRAQKLHVGRQRKSCISQRQTRCQQLHLQTKGWPQHRGSRSPHACANGPIVVKLMAVVTTSKCTDTNSRLHNHSQPYLPQIIHLQAVFTLSTGRLGHKVLRHLSPRL